MPQWIHQQGPTTLILIGAIISALGAVWANIENGKQATEIVSLNKQITETVTGGDSFPTVSTIYTLLQPGELKFPSGLLLSVRGRQSVYDLTVIVTDVERFRELHKSEHFYNMNEYQQRFQLGTLGRAYEQRLIQFPSENKRSFTFHIQSFARNGQFNQRILLRKVNDRWFDAYREFHDEKMVIDHITPGFQKML